MPPTYLIIGAQKAATTSLWAYRRSGPSCGSRTESRSSRRTRDAFCSSAAAGKTSPASIDAATWDRIVVDSCR